MEPLTRITKATVAAARFGSKAGINHSLSLSTECTNSNAVTYPVFSFPVPSRLLEDCRCSSRRLPSMEAVLTAERWGAPRCFPLCVPLAEPCTSLLPRRLLESAVIAAPVADTVVTTVQTEVLCGALGMTAAAFAAATLAPAALAEGTVGIAGIGIEVAVMLAVPSLGSEAASWTVPRGSDWRRCVRRSRASCAVASVSRMTRMWWGRAVDATGDTHDGSSRRVDDGNDEDGDGDDDGTWTQSPPLSQSIVTSGA